MFFKKFFGQSRQPPPLARAGLLKQSAPNLGKLYQDGERIIREGEVVENLYVIQTGCVSLFREDAHGHKIPLNTLQAGDMISDLCVFDRAPNLVSACAVGEARVLTIDKRTLVQRVYEDPALILYLFERMATHTRHLHEELVSYISVSHRLVDLMGHLWGQSTATPLQRMTLQIVEKLREWNCFPHELGNRWSTDLHVACLLYDIGNAGIAKELLESHQKLTPEAFLSVQRHVTIGAKILMQAAQQSDHLSCFSLAAEVAEFHHERYDGSGYHGIVGESIPLSARIIAVVDVYHALCADRPHRPAWSRAQAIEFIGDHQGVFFDPRVVEAFLAVMDAGDVGEDALVS
ncbi:MAG: cyclic nucleotide-binding domain-containing protein [Magnetococcales bacterium]|nr:cyclic nucleotide-binding domain-containing protein [Magnetococcales bacterium]